MRRKGGRAGKAGDITILNCGGGRRRVLRWARIELSIFLFCAKRWGFPSSCALVEGRWNRFSFTISMICMWIRRNNLSQVVSHR